MAAPLFAAAGAEVARELHGRRGRRAQREAAVAQQAASYQTAQVTLIRALADKNGMTEGQFLGLQAELHALRESETERVRLEQRGRTVRRGMAVAALGVMMGGTAGLSLLAVKEFKSVFHIPVEVTTTQRVDAALYKVDQQTDKRLVSGTGTGSADMSMQVKAGPFTLPTAIVGEHANMTLPRTEEISLRQGGTKVKRIEIGGQERVLVLVDPSRVDPEVQGDGDPLPGSGASSGTFNSLLQAVGFDRGEQASALQSVTDLSAQAFEASVARDLTTEKILASLVATDVRDEMKDVAGGLPAAARSAVLQAADSTIFVEYANLKNPQAPTFIAPGQEQSHIRLPEAPQTSSATIGHVVLNMTPSTGRLETVSAAGSLAAITSASGYELLYQPVGVADVAAAPSGVNP